MPCKIGRRAGCGRCRAPARSGAQAPPFAFNPPPDRALCTSAPARRDHCRGPARRDHCRGARAGALHRMTMTTPFVIALRGALALLAAAPAEPAEAGVARRIVRDMEQCLARLEGREGTEADLIAIVCHDLKDPLASIVMGAGFLKKTVPAEDGAAWRVVEAIARSTDRMGQVIGDFHDLAKLEAGRIQLDLRPWDVVAILQAAIPTF